MIWTQVGRVRTASYFWDRTSDNRAKEVLCNDTTKISAFKEISQTSIFKSEDWTLPGKIAILVLEHLFTAESRIQDKRDAWSEFTQRFYSVSLLLQEQEYKKMQDCRYIYKYIRKDIRQNSELELSEHQDFVSKQ